VAALALRVEALRRTAGGHLSRPPLRPLPPTGEVPLSFAQERLWFVEQLQPGSALYNIPQAFRLAGSLLVDLLEQALREVERRHDILRTVFVSVEGPPPQGELPAARDRLPGVDPSPQPEEPRAGE